MKDKKMKKKKEKKAVSLLKDTGITAQDRCGPYYMDPRRDYFRQWMKGV